MPNSGVIAPIGNRAGLASISRGFPITSLATPPGFVRSCQGAVTVPITSALVATAIAFIGEVPARTARAPAPTIGTTVITSPRALKRVSPIEPVSLYALTVPTIGTIERVKSVAISPAVPAESIWFLTHSFFGPSIPVVNSSFVWTICWPFSLAFKTALS